MPYFFVFLHKILKILQKFGQILLDFHEISPEFRQNFTRISKNLDAASTAGYSQGYTGRRTVDAGRSTPDGRRYMVSFSLQLRSACWPLSAIIKPGWQHPGDLRCHKEISRTPFTDLACSAWSPKMHPVNLSFEDSFPII